ncbi:MAG: sortase domain-containing protein [Sporichthyaceae bacterium]
MAIVGPAQVATSAPADVAVAAPQEPVAQEPVASEPVAAVPASPEPAAAEPGVPVALAVPELGIAAAVDAVGVDAAGALALPQEPTRLGWYGAGARPGGPEGSAVIAGHLDRPGGRLGPLAALSRAQPGTQIVVTDDTGVARAFAVRSLQTVAREELYTADPFAASGEAVLVLITCTGSFDRERGVYPANLLVVATPLA